MPNYIEILDEIEDKLITILENHKNEPMNIGELIQKAKKANISKSTTILRDAIMSGGGKGKVKIELIKPKQLLIRVAERKGEKL